MATTTAEWIVQNDKIPRPMNCYFLFLSDFRSKALESGGPGTGRSLKRQHGISRDARDAWRALSSKERELWIEKAERLKEIHEKTYPGYKYLPLGAAESGLAKKGTKKRERAVREWALRKAAEREEVARAKAEADKAAKGRKKGGKAVRGSTQKDRVAPPVRPLVSSGAKDQRPHGVQRSALRRSARQMDRFRGM